MQIIYDYFRAQGSNAHLNDKHLSQKLLSLLLILGCQRMNTIYYFTVDQMTINKTGASFFPSHVLKHSKPGKKLGSFHYRAYPYDNKLCVIECLEEYIKRRQGRVNSETVHLFITLDKPYKMRLSTHWEDGQKTYFVKQGYWQTLHHIAADRPLQVKRNS